MNRTLKQTLIAAGISTALAAIVITCFCVGHRKTFFSRKRPTFGRFLAKVWPSFLRRRSVKADTEASTDLEMGAVEPANPPQRVDPYRLAAELRNEILLGASMVRSEGEHKPKEGTDANKQ